MRPLCEVKPVEQEQTNVAVEPIPLNQRLDPIFILGITERSGTNFLQDVLCLHPQCSKGGLGSQGYLAEDFLPSYAELLAWYADAVSAHWNITGWGIEYLGKDLLCRYLGDGIMSFLNLQLERGGHQVSVANGAMGRAGGVRLVAKTPSVRSLEHFHRVFPSARLLIIVRDGRAVAESAVKTYNVRHEQAAREWAEAAQAIIRFQQTAGSENKYLIVKFEDLYLKLEQELRRIFSFLGLDATNYDFGAAQNLPVRGSSTLAVPGKAVHWRPVQKTASFDPLSRWKHWSRARHERFNWIAGTCMAHLGYETETFGGFRLFWNAWNWMRDKIERLRLLQKTLRHLRSVRLITDLTERKMRRTGVEVDVVVRMANQRLSAYGLLAFFKQRPSPMNHTALAQALHASAAHTVVLGHWSAPIAILLASCPVVVGFAREAKSHR
jgi:protein-tyrosine sulfotransferase